MKRVVLYMLLLIVGAVLGVTGYGTYAKLIKDPMAEEQDSQEPLYWVAPMDPNYRRDQPGKSPMGMDLIPVYEEEGDEQDDGAGVVRISPAIENNLGVRTAHVDKGVFDSEIRTIGYVQYDEDQLVHIHPRVEGWIEKLYVTSEGDPVEKGEPLYDIYSPTLVNAQQELVLAVNRGNPRLIRAAEERLQALQVPATTIQAVKNSKRVHQSITIYAPQDGVVDNLNIREGFFVKPGTSMLSIGALEEVWVVGEVFERQAALVEEGDEVTLTSEYLPGKTWNGTVDYIYPTLNSKTRTAQVRTRLDNSDRLLKPNMFMQLTIHSRSDNTAQQIPREALIRTGEQNRVVLALGDGKFKSIEVEVGRIGEDVVEILDGLAVGERIVTSAQFLLDSESSKTSDFMRMDHAQNDSAQAQDEHAGMDHVMEDDAAQDQKMDQDAHAGMNHTMESDSE
ncbi:membrane fusion protein, Cu(I)/Ag(I) efflux system [Modicisalibacter ilicicola DSM 19980]|uniref:Membrane fusion protein, Cu(I)/Ag(I) efflux system n=1 Tax=Modicisalibacter ilicicola DSM 19980 TaxID=1121942 RepID=A0A1M5DM67_9GAMM|nr:efflux RND transporter periplasmic adaptor subunit [Halomonas ilicicola]SHF68073.1 membrane fusion protein, Cu(I)/Ag(I) efflux system [Halomonas ilicicola DSM 19980]